MDWVEIIKIGLPAVLTFYLGRFSVAEYKLKHFAEIFVKPTKIGDMTWEFQIRNAGSSIIYLSKIEPEGRLATVFRWGFTRNKQLTLPVGEYYSFVLERTLAVGYNIDEVRLNVEFEDRLGKKYMSHHVAWWQDNHWSAQNARAEEIKKNRFQFLKCKNWF